MHLKKLFADEEAVSPVIGVILMVAITVILAAVIASFVLGLGNQAGTVQPQTSFSFDYDNSTNPPGSFDGNLTVQHQSGDSIKAEELYLRGSGFYQEGDGALNNQSWLGYVGTGNATTSGEVGSAPAVVGGDRAEITANSDYEIDVVWESTEGDSSATLGSDQGPDA
jgi:flagellin-like protein